MNVKDSMALLDEFLGEIEKEAVAPTDPDATQPGDSSNTKKEDLKKLESEDDGITDSQTNLGKEQVAAARASGSTADETPENTDADGRDPVDEDTPKKLDIDQPARGNSEALGTVKKQEINMEQKLARAEGMASAIISVIEKEITKEAAQKPAAKTVKPNLEDMLLEKMAKEAEAAAQDYFESHILGQITRLRDEMELKEAKLDPQVLNKVGGVSGLLDKVAAEMPEAVLPEGMGGLPPEALAGLPPEAAGEMPPEAAGEMPPEMGAEAPVEGAEGDDISEEELSQLADELDQAGVSPEDLQQAFEDIQSLQEAGVQPDELAQAIEQLNAEGGEAGTEEAPGELPPEEEVPEEVPEEAPVEEKAASDNRRVDMIKEFLKR